MTSLKQNKEKNRVRKLIAFFCQKIFVCFLGNFQTPDRVTKSNNYTGVVEINKRQQRTIIRAEIHLVFNYIKKKNRELYALCVIYRFSISQR